MIRIHYGISEATSALAAVPSGPLKRVLTLVRVAYITEHPRVTFQAHAVRIFSVSPADNVSAPGTFHLEFCIFKLCFPIHLSGSPA